MGVPPLKMLRLNAGLTQTQVAELIDVSQPNYQNWESGAAAIPEDKLKKLAKALSTSINEILGKSIQFDISNPDNKVVDSQTYFGEIAVHFKSGYGNLLLPVTEGSREEFHSQMHKTSNFLCIESLDNRVIFIRRDAITDIYISSEAFNDYGPEEYSDYFGLLSDDDFWHIVENREYLDDIVPIFGSEKVSEVLAHISTNDQQLQKYQLRATNANWQSSYGPTRFAVVHDSEDVFNTFSVLDDELDDLNEAIYLPAEGYHRTIFINKNSIDYISIPAHKFHEGLLLATQPESTEH